MRGTLIAVAILGGHLAHTFFLWARMRTPGELGHAGRTGGSIVRRTFTALRIGKGRHTDRTFRHMFTS